MKSIMFFFLKVYVFENLLIFNALYQKYIANITLLNGVLHFSFTILLKKWALEKRRWYLSKEKKAEEKQNSATTIISKDGEGAVFPVKLKSQSESFE